MNSCGDATAAQGKDTVVFTNAVTCEAAGRN